MVNTNKKLISLLLVVTMLCSLSISALATTDYTNGTTVTYVGQGSEAYTVKVPATMSPNSSAAVTASGTWASNRKLVVTSDSSVELTSNINANDKKTLTVTFDGIEKTGDNTVAVSATADVSVGNIVGALFGTWSGKFNYYVSMMNASSDEEVIDTALYFMQPYTAQVEMEYNGEIVTTNMTLALYEDGSGMGLGLVDGNVVDGISFPAGYLTYSENAIIFPEEYDNLTFTISDDKKSYSGDFGDMHMNFVMDNNKPYYGRPYSCIVSTDDGDMPISITTYADGSSQIYVNGALLESLPAGTATYDKNIVLMGGMPMGALLDGGRLFFIPELDGLTNLLFVLEPATENLAPGLYASGSNYQTMTMTWDELIANDIIKVEDGVVYTLEKANLVGTTNPAAEYLNGDLVLPSHITSLGSVDYENTSDGIIGKLAFPFCENLTNIVIPNSVTTIGPMSFSGCTNLTNLQLPNSIITIGDFGFAGYVQESIKLPNSLKTIGSAAFGLTTLTSITIPDGVTSIGENAFSLSINLKNISIPASVTHMEKAPFGGTYKLEAITINENNPVFKSIDGIVYSKDGKTLIHYPAAQAGDTFTIPSHVTTIDKNAFDEPDFKAIIIHQNVTNISNGAFSLCYHLQNIVVDDNHPTLKSIDGVLYSKDGKTLICHPIAKYDFDKDNNRVVTIRDGVTTIAKNALNHNAPDILIIPTSVTTIESGACSVSALTHVCYMGTEEQWNNIEDYSIGTPTEYNYVLK